MSWIQSLLFTGLSLIFLALLFIPLEKAFPAKPGQRLFRPEWMLDMTYFAGQYLLWSGLVLKGLDWIEAGVRPYLASGLQESISAQPIWLQAIEVLLLSDMLVYWGHRLQHKWDFLWRFHKVHHSAEHLDWLAAHREHPLDSIYTVGLINLPAILMGFDLNALVLVVAFRGIWAIYIHSNVRLPLGPLKVLIGSPELHHWHHDKERDRGNYANISPLMDIIFGTYVCPPKEPDAFGIKEEFPRSYVGQLVHPMIPGIVRRWLGSIRKQRMVKTWIPLGLFFILSSDLCANDGAFYAAGNQLVPIHETSVSVKKEILSMKKVNNEYVDVTVYYEFFNPGPEKTITVGFEAGRPLGDVDGTPRNGQHPYIYDFTVMMNDGFLKYEIAYVDDSLYEEKGVIKSRKLEEVLKSIDNENAVDFGYVYHFKARFKTGLNTIRHTYRYKVSNSVETLYDIEYVLTAAKRWGNKQIDDFTLILDMGNFESFNLEKSFFSDKKDWILTGIGKCMDTLLSMPRLEKGKLLRFHIRNGMAVFHARNFKPKGELRLYAERFIVEGRVKNYLEFSIDYYSEGYGETTDPFRRKVYRNLPFARRGYIFQAADLQAFFSKMDWYMPDPNYQPDMDMLDEREKKWISRWK